MRKKKVREHPMSRVVRQRREYADKHGLCLLCDRRKDDPCETCVKAYEKASAQWDAVYGLVSKA